MKKDIMSDFTTEFYVNSEKGTVTCVLRPEIDNAMIAISRATGIMPCSLPPFLLLNDRYEATARCSASDEFDEKTGKDIAFRKAYLKYAVAMAKKAEMFKKDVKKVAEKWLNGAETVVENYTGKEKIAYNKLQEKLSKVE